MKIITAIFWLCISQVAFANDIAWHQGSVVLNDKSVLRGEVAVEGAYDLVLFRDTSGLMVYPAHKISALYYHDIAENINRKFVSVPETNGSKKYSLYETVFYSEILVVRKIVNANADPSDHSASYRYFVVHQNELVPFRAFKAKVFDRLKALVPSFGNEVQEQKLDPTSAEDIIPILRLYLKHQNIYAANASSF